MILWWLAGAALLAGGGAERPARDMRQAARPATPAPSAAADALARRYVAEGRAPGISIAIGTPAGTRFASAGRVGTEAGAAPAGPDSLWRIYSMTKPITGMAAMMLVEDGKLKLDQPVADFIPAFASMRVLTDPAAGLESRPATKPITVRHLLTHTSGMGYAFNARGPLLRAYEQAGVVPFTATAAIEAQVRPRRPDSLAEFANRAAAIPLVAEPGTRWTYSMGLDVMGRVIEVASGMSFERFLQTRMFGPLRMTSTYWSVPTAEVRRLADVVTFFGDRMISIDSARSSPFLSAPSFPYGGAGLVSSARDYDRFLAMLANGGTLDGVRVMRRETVALGMSDLLPTGVTFRPEGGGPRMGYGAGGSVQLADVPGGPGRGTYGWTGAAGTVAWVDPARKLRAVGMVNYFPATRWPLRQDLVRAAYTGRP